MFPKSLLTRLLSTYEISDEILTKLSSNGFNHKTEIEAINESELQTICCLTDEEMDSINEVIRKSHEIDFEWMSSFELFTTEPQMIRTGSQSMDNILNGGVEVCRLTQLCGEGGTGKTQICMQLCINVQMPQEFGGLSGEALYIDTEDNIRPERLESMAKHCIKRYKSLNKALSVDYIKSHVHLKTCNKEAQELVEIINNQIEPFIEKNPKIRLVVIDSIAHLFRYGYESKGETKEYELAQIAHKLKLLAHFKKVAILITNQVTHNPEENRNIPSLGKQWQTVCSTSLMIERSFDGNPRVGYVLKSISIPENKKFYFYVTENGIQNVNE